MRIIAIIFFAFCFCTSAQAEVGFGKKFQVKNDALDFETRELLIDGKFVGYVYGDVSPIKFSNNYYVYASCPTDRVTGKPDGYCTKWMIYDIRKKAATSISMTGLGFFSEPSFHWPYVAYVKVPKEISQENFQSGLVKVSCVVVEWPKKSVVAQKEVAVNVGHFETDAPGSFFPPKFAQVKENLNVSFEEYTGKEEGNVIATVTVPRTN
ncbi:MAG: hypothetical protein PHY62_05485 [Gallionella sp.]|nr:hypothetical protein [Gallionella sp.]